MNHERLQKLWGEHRLALVRFEAREQCAQSWTDIKQLSDAGLIAREDDDFAGCAVYALTPLGRQVAEASGDAVEGR